MKKTLLCILLCTGLGACGGKTTTDSTEIQNTDSIAAVETITELPPLAEGEVFP